jgi:transposase-like protein
MGSLEVPDLGNEDEVMGEERTAGKPTTKWYSPEEKARAVRLVRQLREELGTSHGTIQRVADQIGCEVESLRTWAKQADIDGCRAGPDLERGGGAEGAAAGEPGAAPRQRPAGAGLGFLRGGSVPICSPRRSAGSRSRSLRSKQRQLTMPTTRPMT